MKQENTTKKSKRPSIVVTAEQLAEVGIPVDTPHGTELFFREDTWAGEQYIGVFKVNGSELDHLFNVSPGMKFRILD